MINNIFKWNRYAPWYRKIKQLPRTIKYMWQRCKRGFAESDLWDLSYFYATLIRDSLVEFKKKNEGYPGNLTFEKWQQILDEMITCFSNYVEEIKNPYETQFFNLLHNHENIDPENIKDKYFTEELEIDNWKTEQLKKGFDLLIKWFPDLWW